MPVRGSVVPGAPGGVTAPGLNPRVPALVPRLGRWWTRSESRLSFALRLRLCWQGRLVQQERSWLSLRSPASDPKRQRLPQVSVPPAPKLR